MINKFAEILNELLLERGIKAYQMSKDLSISHGLISCWRRGIKIPSADSLMRVAAYFNVSVDELLGMEDYLKSLDNR